jgi:hypothetical protein
MGSASSGKSGSCQAPLCERRTGEDPGQARDAEISVPQRNDTSERDD